MGYIRDLAGIKNKENKELRKHFLLRSASLDKPTNEQVKYLNDIKLKRIFDLRNEEEANYDPDITIEGCTYYNYSLIDSDLNGVTHQNKKKQLMMLKELETMKECYVGMFEDDFALKNIKAVINKIVKEDGFPTIVHCATGKDRAGVVTMLLLTILDFDYNVILEDYMKQKKMYIPTAFKYGILAFLGSGDVKLAKKAYDYFAIRKEFLDASIDTINRKFGSLELFIKNYIGLTEKDIIKFKEKVLQ